MKILESITAAALFAIAAAIAAPAYAQAMNHGNMPGMMMEKTATAEMSDGEVRKIDKDSLKVTLKHGEIKNLEMPGMTMVFRVKDAEMLDKVQVGSIVKFVAEKLDGGFFVTAIHSLR